MNQTSKVDNHKIHRFHGGIEVIKNKGLELEGIDDFKAVSSFQPERVYIPLQQHIGAPSDLLVSEGDYVKMGQIIGQKAGTISANVHSSVSGTVISIEERVQSGNNEVLCVVIENDGKNQLESDIPYKGQSSNLTSDQIADCAEHAGIVGLGGATFPTHVKLSPREEIHTIIFNSAECEPLLMADEAMMFYYGDLFLEGCIATIKATGAEKGIIGIEADKAHAIEHLKSISQDYPEVEVKVVPSRYPQGATETLIKALTGKEPPVGVSSRKMGIIIINVATVIAIAESLNPGYPLIHRICSVVGDVGKPQNILFPLGTRAGDVIDFCGGFKGVPSKVIMGGLMMGKTLTTVESSLTKAANGLVVINEEHDSEYEESPCIRCGRCVYVCPMKLLPHQLDKYGRLKRWDRVEKLKIEACINCGCCTYICPAKRKLAETITDCNSQLKEIKKDGK